jgi:hypothetical protein
MLLLSDYPLGIDANSLPSLVAGFALVVVLTMYWIIPAFVIGALIGRFGKENGKKRKRR